MIARTNNLPIVKGRYQLQALLSQQTWFQVGGAAEVLFKPRSESDLIIFLQQKSDDIPITLIGAGSNILVRDGGIEGIVIAWGGVSRKLILKEQLLLLVVAHLIERLL